MLDPVLSKVTFTANAQVSLLQLILTGQKKPLQHRFTTIYTKIVTVKNSVNLSKFGSQMKLRKSNSL